MYVAWKIMDLKFNGALWPLSSSWRFKLTFIPKQETRWFVLPCDPSWFVLPCDVPYEMRWTFLLNHNRLPTTLCVVGGGEYCTTLRQDGCDECAKIEAFPWRLLLVAGKFHLRQSKETLWVQNEAKVLRQHQGILITFLWKGFMK